MDLFLNRVELNNFRNYIQDAWEPAPGINLISGDNAQGKTNLLESIYIGTSSRSFQNNRVQDCINWHRQKANLSFSFNTGTGLYNVFFYVEKGGKKTLKINGKKRKPGEALPYPAAVVFLPEDLYIVQGRPSQRRRYIDLELGMVDSSYYYYLRQYQKTLVQRNNFLREASPGTYQDASLLEVWNEQLVNAGSQLLARRLNLLQKYVPLVRNLFYHLTGGKESLNISYLSSLGIAEKLDPGEIKTIFSRELQQVRREEKKRGQTLKGPHRDDIAFYIDGVDGKNFGSRGQQRTIVLALKLALLQLWQRETGEYPILLLDDVLQELDPAKQEQLLSRIRGTVQTFLTTSSEREQALQGIEGRIKVAGGKLQGGM